MRHSQRRGSPTMVLPRLENLNDPTPRKARTSWTTTASETVLPLSTTSRRKASTLCWSMSSRSFWASCRESRWIRLWMHGFRKTCMKTTWWLAVATYSRMLWKARTIPALPSTWRSPCITISMTQIATPIIMATITTLRIHATARCSLWARGIRADRTPRQPMRTVVWASRRSHPSETKSPKQHKQWNLVLAAFSWRKKKARSHKRIRLVQIWQNLV